MDTNMSNDKRTPWLPRISLRQGYLLALGLIFLVASMKVVVLNTLFEVQDSAAAVINVSGRQRMLSQRTAFFTAAYAKEENLTERSRIRSALLRTLDEFEKNHKALIEGDQMRGLPVLDNPAVYDVYYNAEPALDDLITRYIAAARTVLNLDGSKAERDQALDYIFMIGPDVLLKQLNEVVQLHEQKARADVKRLSDLQKIFWGITVLILILEGLFLFRPMERRIARNMIDLKKREEKIQEQYEELSSFTFISSHNLQEPLRKVVTFSDRLAQSLEGKLESKDQQYMDFIRAGAVHMRELVAGLHAYAGILAGGQEDIKNVHSADAVRLAVKKVSQTTGIGNLDVSYSDLPVVFCDKGHLVTVFECLLDNAVKYRSSPDLIVTIEAERSGDHVRFCVTDNGMGIDEKYFGRIFFLFQRLHRKEEIPGTGLGLAMVKKIVERYGGSVWVESEEGSGARFYFTLPREVT